MADLAPLDYPVFQAFDANGDPLVNGKVEFFDAGTANQRDTYSDPGLTTANPNPVTLNSRGEPESGGGTPINIYPDASPYKIVLKDSDDVTIRTIDDYLRPDVGESISAPKDPINATDVGTDVFEAVFTDPKSGEVFTIDFQSSNTMTTPTLENTGGSLGALTIKTRDGSPVWVGAVNGSHSLYYDGTDLLLLDPRFGQNLSTSGTVTFRGQDPEHATDGGTDAYVSATNTTPPAAGVTIYRDFQSANTTTTPTLDTLTITTKDGSALWANALEGVHELQLNAGGTAWLVLDPRWQLATFWAGHIDGLELSNNSTDSAHDIDIETGVCSMRDGSGNRKLFELTSSLTKQIDANWSEGTDSGGFPSGLTLSADTTYHVFLIGKDDGSVDAGFDTSTSASNLLSDASAYSWFRRIGSLFTDGSSNLVQFTQSSFNADEFLLDDPVNDYSVSNPGNSAALRVVAVPGGGVKVQAIHVFQIIIASGAPGGSSVEGIVTSPDQNDVTPVFDLNDVRNIAQADATAASVSRRVRTDTSGQIRTRIAGSGTSVTIRGFTHGWVDNRGRNE